MARNVHANVAEAFGKTPLVRLNRLTEGIDAEVYAKLEFYNPGSSVKDRLAISIIEHAEAEGSLQPGGIIVEATSGNTGIGLALVGAARGYRVILTMPENLNLERRQLMRAYGAEVILTPVAEGMQGSVDRALEIVRNTPGTVLANQFATPANAAIHRRTTAVEIWEDTAGEVDIFVAGVGTGGTITGVGEVLKQRKPGVQVVAVEPAESPMLSEGRFGPHKIPGIGPNFRSQVFDASFVDEIVTVPSEVAAETARQAARLEGILSGISGGAAISAALEVARRPQNAGKTVVLVIPDSGERYLTTYLFKHTLD
ncbi:MAG: cysteine synthase A [Trueperaceae bacterium]|nr:cysteine synthase A [Trueperaceae bacterium]